MQKCMTPLKSLFAVVLALSLVLMGQPAEAQAGTAKVTFDSDGKGTVSGDYELNLSTQATVYDGGAIVNLGELRNPEVIQPNTGYVFDYWTANAILYRSRWGWFVDPAPIGYQISSFSEEFYTASDVTLTAHFKLKPAAVTYTTDGHGSVSKSGESVELNEEHPCGAETLAVGKLGGTTATPTDSTKYAFDYWTADKDVYKLENDKLTTIAADTKLASLEDYYVSGDVTFTAHFSHKPITVTYTADDHGTVGKDNESVEIDKEYACGEETLAVGKPDGTTATSTDSAKYAFDYWTADKDVYKLENNKLTTIATGTKLASTTDCYVADAVTFTAHFKQIAGNVTYTSAGHGSVSPKTETLAFTEQTIDAAGTKAMAGTPTGATANPDEDYNFSHWTASSDVIVLSDFSTITAGDKITNDQLSSILVTGDTTFTAHFSAKPVTVSYTTDGNGTVTKTSQTVERASTHPLGSDPTKELAVGQPRYEVFATANKNYMLNYWTASADVYVLDGDTMRLSVYKAGTHLPNENVSMYYVEQDTTYTAHFFRTAYDVTYKTAGHGTVSPASEKVAVDSTPAGCTITPDKDYEFSHWVANVDIEVSEKSAQPQAGTTTIAAGEPITDEQLKQAVSFSDDPVFTAYFKHKPVTVSYAAGDNGFVDRDSESVEIDKEYKSGENMLPVGQPGGATATPFDSAKYALGYWTADKDVYKYENAQLTTIAAGAAIASPEDCYVADAVTFTAHFKQISGNVTYISADHGSVSPGFETVAFSEQAIDAAGTKAMAGTPSGVATSPDAGYEFDYWTANIDVISVTDFSVFAAGDKITNEQLGASLITKDATFTAHFKHKPARISYTTDGHGSVGKDSESVEIDKEYKSGENMLPVGQPGGTTATPLDSTRYAFDYWTADKDVYTCKDDELTTIAAGTKLDRLPADYYVAEDVVFTAHFLRTAYSVTYKTAGHGTVSPTSEKVAVGNTPTGCTITPDKGYEFGHWTANVSVEVANEDASQVTMLADDDAEPQAGTTTIAAGDLITDEQLKRAVSFSSDPVFTAHFKQTSSKTDDADKTDDPSTPSTPSAPSNPSATNNPSATSTANTPIITNATSATSNSNGSGGTGNSGGNSMPATGDALSGATVVFFFCAGIVAALTAFFRRRNC